MTDEDVNPKEYMDSMRQLKEKIYEACDGEDLRIVLSAVCSLYIEIFTCVAENPETDLNRMILLAEHLDKLLKKKMEKAKNGRE